MSYLQSALEKMLMSQGRAMSASEKGLLQAAQQPTPTQDALAQMMNPPPEQSMPQQLPMQMAANDPYGGVSMQTRKAMNDIGAADPTGEFGDAMIGRGQVPQGFTSKTSVRGAQSPAQEEQLVKMLRGRGMSDAEARARIKSM